MHIIESEGLIDRINWMKQQTKQPDNYEQLRGGSPGTLSMGTIPNHRTMGLCNPTRKQFCETMAE